MQEAFSQISVMLNIIRTVFGFVMSLLEDKIYFEHLLNCLLTSKDSDVKDKTMNFIGLKKKLFFNDNSLSGDCNNSLDKRKSLVEKDSRFM